MTMVMISLGCSRVARRRRRLPAPNNSRSQSGSNTLPKGIHRTKQGIQVEYTHADTSLGDLTGCRKPHHIPLGGILLIPNSR